MATVIEGVGLNARPAFGFTRVKYQQQPTPLVSTAAGQAAPAPQRVTLYRTAPASSLPPVEQQLPKNAPLLYISQKNTTQPDVSTSGPAPGTSVEQPAPAPGDMVYQTAPGPDVVLDVEKQGMSPWLIGLGVVAGAGLLFVLFTSRSEDRE